MGARQHAYTSDQSDGVRGADFAITELANVWELLSVSHSTKTNFNLFVYYIYKNERKNVEDR